MKISNLLFGANIKIPERHEDGTYKLADYTLGIFGAGVLRVYPQGHTQPVPVRRQHGVRRS